jgi:autotransporter-associated beta strand protein
VQWRFIVPYTPSPVVWTGSNSTTWVNANNWVNTQQIPPFSQTANNLVLFNNLSASNLNTVLNFTNNAAVSNNFTVYGITVSNPPAPVSIGATNTLVIGNFIDLSGASQDLTITSPIFIGGQQGYARHFWMVNSGRTLSLNGGVAGVDDLIIAYGGTVSLAGTNTYSGNTTISNNTLLTISGAGQLGAGNYVSTIVDNGTFNYNSSASQTLSGFVTGTGSITVNGPGTLLLSGTNTYTGATIINSGSLALSGNQSFASTNILVAGGAMFDVSSLNAAFVLGGGSLANSSTGAVICGNNNCSAGTLALISDGVNPAFIQTNGTLTISGSTVIKVNNTGIILGAGHHPLIGVATTGSTGAVTGSLPTVVVAGNGVSGSVSLQINGSGGLDLVVTSTTSTSPPNLGFAWGGGVLTLTWPGDHLGWVAQSNAVSIINSNYWFDMLGSQSNTSIMIPVNPGATNIFYRLRYPY